ncbi:MAG: hypothetical protein B6D61_05445 [Bacteroidetes bacterium 4484_249]|nr:MAG: hypothetical protein B6D61_05445 [Bacteroidetes bacterium 4484_249]
MKRIINNIISIIFTLIKFSLIKLFHWNNFKFHIIERFSPNTDLYFIGKGRIILGKKVRAHTHVRLRAIKNGTIKIGNNTSFNYGCMVTALENITIGSGVEFGPNVLLYDHDHDFRTIGGLKEKKFKTGKIVIGDNAWIGANTIILKNTKIGKNCVVGAGSIITGDYPDNTIIVQKRQTTVKNIIPQT